MLAALFVGAATTALSFAYLKKQTGAGVEPSATIYVAREDLPEGTQITESNVKKMSLPASMTDLRAQTLGEADNALLEQELRTNRFIPAGQPIMYTHLIETRDIELRADERAMTMSVQGANGLSGLLVPGDFVEIYVTRQLPSTTPTAPSVAPADPGAAIAMALTQAASASASAEYKTSKISDDRFEVIAVGNQLARTRRQMLLSAQQSDSLGQGNQFVTIRVQATQVGTLLEKTGAGQLPVTLVLTPGTAKQR